MGQIYLLLRVREAGSSRLKHDTLVESKAKRETMLVSMVESKLCAYTRDAMCCQYTIRFIVPYISLDSNHLFLRTILFPQWKQNMIPQSVPDSW